MKTLLSCVVVTLGLLLLTQSPTNAGVLLTQSGQAQSGTLIESGEMISLQTQFGLIGFKKSELVWYALDRQVDTLFKAAQKAASEGNSTAALKLFQLSVAKEPATQMQAQQELQALRSAVVTQATTPPDAGTTESYDHLTPEQKIARGKQMIENGKTQHEMLKTSTKLADPSKGVNVIPIGQSGPNTIPMGQNSHIPPSVSDEEKTRKAADALIHDGEELVKLGEAELADKKAREEEERKQREEIAAAITEAKASYAGFDSFQEWTRDEKLANGAVVSVFLLAILGILWQMTMKDH